MHWDSKSTRLMILEQRCDKMKTISGDSRACSGSTYIKIGTIQRRLAWPLRKDDTQIREAFQIFHF